MQVGGCLDSINWISLADYSAKYKVSISTLRRRIKNEQVEYAFDSGKYYLPDLDIKAISKAKKSFSSRVAPPKKVNSLEDLQLGQHFYGKDFLENFDNSFTEVKNHDNGESSDEGDFMFSKEEVANAVNAFNHPEAKAEKKIAKDNMESSSMKEALDHMTKELKKAYSAILQEKEEQLILLKEQVADLKTLVNILEEENQRLHEHKNHSLVTPHVIREKTQF